MKGKIELSKEGPPTNPEQATAPPGLKEVNKRLKASPPVSYTHLTLPTILLV